MEGMPAQAGGGAGLGLPISKRLMGRWVGVSTFQVCPVTERPRLSLFEHHKVINYNGLSAFREHGFFCNTDVKTER